MVASNATADSDNPESNNMKIPLSQSAHGRAIDCTDLISGNANYTDLGDGWMDVLLHKPAVPAAGQPFVPERVELVLSNPGSRRIEVHVDFNGQSMTYKVDRKSQVLHVQTVQGYGSSAVVSVRKQQGDPLFVCGGAEN